MGLLTYVGLRRPNKWERYTLLDHLLLSPLTFIVCKLYHVFNFLRGRPFLPPKDQPPIRVVCISDTHDQFVDIPNGDVLIHAGDLTNAGTAEDIQKQLDWLKEQPHALKVVIAGNHDSYFDPNSRADVDVQSGAEVNLDGLVYLENSLTEQEINGRRISIFGVPDIPRFQYDRGNEPWFSKVPPQTDILVTHCPPAHHLDNGLGDRYLLDEVWRVQPRLHVFGHVHCGFGTEPIYYDDLQKAYERLLRQPRRGLLWDFFPNSSWLDMFQIVAYGTHAVLWKWFMAGPGSNQGSLMVNAGQMYGNTGKVRSRAVIVDI